MEDLISKISNKLEEIILDERVVYEKVNEVQKIIWESLSGKSEDYKVQLLYDLAYDLDFYAPSLVSIEGGVYFGDQRAREAIRATLTALSR